MKKIFIISCSSDNNEDVISKKDNVDSFSPEETGVLHNKILEAIYETGTKSSSTQYLALESTEELVELVYNKFSDVIKDEYPNMKLYPSEEVFTENKAVYNELMIKLMDKIKSEGEDSAINYLFNSLQNKELFSDKIFSKNDIEMLLGGKTKLKSTTSTTSQNFEIYFKYYNSVYIASEAYWNEVKGKTKSSIGAKTIIADAAGGLLGGVWDPVVGACASCCINEAEPTGNLLVAEPTITTYIDSLLIKEYLIE